MSSISGFTELNSNSNNFPDQNSNNNENTNMPKITTWPRGELVDDCINSSVYDACVTYKNPVYHNNNTAFNNGLTDNTNLYQLKLQNFAVKLNDLDNSGFLQNDFFQIDPNFNNNNNQDRATENNNGNWMYSYDDDVVPVNQINLYYWLNEFRSYLDSFHDTELTAGSFFNIDSFDNTGVAVNNAYFVPDANDVNGNIVMGVSTLNGNNHHNSISADVSIHESCHGYFHFASNGNLSQIDTTTHTGTGFSQCTNTDGCLRALHEGQADFCTYIMFPEAPTLGEAFMNDNEGFELRNFNNTKNATANQQFQNAQAAIHNYGALYSSMWKTVWDQAKANNNQKDIEKIFLSHLVLLDFRETFITALDAIKIVIADEFPNGNYTQLFENEWNRRGL